MNNVFVTVEPIEMPLSESVHLLQGTLEQSEDVIERRQGISDLEFASILLSHAVRYLSSEQRAGRCISVRGNRQAIKVLCDCAESLTELERREPALLSLHRWIDRARRA